MKKLIKLSLDDAWGLYDLLDEDIYSMRTEVIDVSALPYINMAKELLVWISKEIKKNSDSVEFSIDSSDEFEYIEDLCQSYLTYKKTSDENKQTCCIILNQLRPEKETYKEHHKKYAQWED